MNPCRLLKLIVSVVFFVTPSLGNTNQTSAKELSASIRNDLQPIVEYAKRTQKSERLNTILAGLDSLANDGDSPNDVYQTFLRRIANDSTLQNILAEIQVVFAAETIGLEVDQEVRDFVTAFAGSGEPLFESIILLRSILDTSYEYKDGDIVGHIDSVEINSTTPARGADMSPLFSDVTLSRRQTSSTMSVSRSSNNSDLDLARVAISLPATIVAGPSTCNFLGGINSTIDTSIPKAAAYGLPNNYNVDLIVENYLNRYPQLRDTHLGSVQTADGQGGALEFFGPLFTCLDGQYLIRGNYFQQIVLQYGVTSADHVLIHSPFAFQCPGGPTFCQVAIAICAVLDEDANLGDVIEAAAGQPGPAFRHCAEKFFGFPMYGRINLPPSKITHQFNGQCLTTAGTPAESRPTFSATETEIVDQAGFGYGTSYQSPPISGTAGLNYFPPPSSTYQNPPSTGGVYAFSDIQAFRPNVIFAAAEAMDTANLVRCQTSIYGKPYNVDSTWRAQFRNDFLAQAIFGLHPTSTDITLFALLKHPPYVPSTGTPGIGDVYDAIEDLPSPGGGKPLPITVPSAGLVCNLLRGRPVNCEILQ